MKLGTPLEETTNFSTKQPFLLAKGSNKSAISRYHIVLDGHYLPCEEGMSSLGAFDLLFKTHFAFGYCEPVQVWMMARHGTRNPSKRELADLKVLNEIRNQIVRNHDDRHYGSLCEDDLNNLKKWNLDVSVVQADDLTNQGHMDMEFIARRMKTRFSSLLTQAYTPDRYTFRYTDTQRTRASAEAFAAGLFGGPEGKTQLPRPTRRGDPVFETYYNCSWWVDHVRDNPQTYREYDLFVNGTHMAGVVQAVSERLGFRYKLTSKQINNMYDMCRYDKAWLINELSPWCAVFTKKELEILEYANDLRYYYKQGYGNEVNAKLGCPPVKDLMMRFSELENGTSRQQPVGVFYFTHSTAVQTTITALGIAKDFPKLLHTNYGLMQRREWRTSEIGPFASNIAAVFYKCTRGEQHRVMFFLQERVVPYEGCDVGLCSWEYIKEKFSKTVADCRLNDFCLHGGNTGEGIRAAGWVVTSLAAIVAAVNCLH